MQYRKLILLASLLLPLYCRASQELPPPINQLSEAPVKDTVEHDEEDAEINALLESTEIENPEIAEHSAFVTWLITWRNRIGIRIIENPVGLKLFDGWMYLRTFFQ